MSELKAESHLIIEQLSGLAAKIDSINADQSTLAAGIIYSFDKVAQANALNEFLNRQQVERIKQLERKIDLLKLQEREPTNEDQSGETWQDWWKSVPKAKYKNERLNFDSLLFYYRTLDHQDQPLGIPGTEWRVTKIWN